MGRAKSAEFFSFEAKKCACSLFLPEDNDCCQDESEILIIDDFQSAEAYTSSVAPDFYVIREIFTESSDAEEIANTSIQLFTPLANIHLPKEPLFKTHSSFVFYDSDGRAWSGITHN